MENEAEEENDEDYHGVVDAEIIKIPPQARHGFRVVVGKGDEGVIEEHAPWTACSRLGSSS